MHQFHRPPAEASVRIDALSKYESLVKLSNSTNKKDPDLYLAAKRPGSAIGRRISIDAIKIIVLQKKQRQRKNKSTPARAMPNLHRNRKACVVSIVFTKFAKLERPLLRTALSDRLWRLVTLSAKRELREPSLSALLQF
jgi:hypothetical protein